MRAALIALLTGLTVSGSALANPSTADPAKVPAGTYVLDKRHASLTLRIAHLGFSHYTLRMDSLDGGFTYDPANWQATKLTFTVDPKSVDTHDPAFDKQIAGYFEPEKYPAITFVSTAVEGVVQDQETKGTVSGDLSLHGVTRPVTLDVTFDGAGHGVGPLGTRLGFSGSTRIKRSDFGLSNFVLNQFTSDDVDVIFELEFEKK